VTFLDSVAKLRDGKSCMFIDSNIVNMPAMLKMGG